MQNKNDDDKLEDNFEDEFEYENDFNGRMEEDLGFIGDGNKKPILMIITIVLAAIAIILLCVVIWMMTHPKKGEDSNQVANDQTQEQFVETNKDETIESTVEETIEDSIEDTKESSPVSTEEPLPESSEPSKETVPSSQVPEEVPTDSPQEMAFQSVEESVTAKEMVNLRSLPQSGDDSNLVVQLKNGEIIARVGINSDTGWSKLEYNGQTVYAVSNYLTTDLDYKPVDYSTSKNPNTVVTSNNRTITFTNCDDTVTPKILVNVRTEPQTEGDANIYTTLEAGVHMHRTGFDIDSGWSRVEYDDKVLYVVTSLVKVVE